MWLGGSVDQFYVDVAGLFRDQAINITDLRSFVRRIDWFVHFAVITQHVCRLALALRINMIPDLLQSITYVMPFIFPITRYYTLLHVITRYYTLLHVITRYYTLLHKSKV
jgi:hypothetical protein